MGKVTGMVSMNSFRLKAILSLICIILCTWHIGFYHGCPWENHFLYSFFHVNGFHLAINLLVLWQDRAMERCNQKGWTLHPLHDAVE